jgi:hypothetical protein
MAESALGDHNPKVRSAAAMLRLSADQPNNETMASE